MKTTIFLCYGTFTESNEEYKQYIEWFLKDSEENSAEKIIICGGHTNNTTPDISEAQTVFEYLQKIKPEISNVELEDQSLTTNQNLEFASKKISPDDQITIYCDLARMAKIIWMAGAYLLHKDRKEIADIFFEFAKEKKLRPFQAWNLTVKYFDFPSRDKYQCIAQSFSSLIEVEAIYDPSIEEKIITQRHLDFGV
jgi:hypothetical protein